MNDQDQVNVGTKHSSSEGVERGAGEAPDAVAGLAGRELDTAVAERVMGWQRQPQYNYWMTFPEGESFQLHALIATWKPSANMATAMQAVEKLLADGWAIQIWGFRGKYEVTFAKGHTFKWAGVKLEEAICRAALAAVARNAPEAGRGDRSR